MTFSRVMDGSSLRLMDGLDHITLGENEATDFSMKALALKDLKSIKAELGVSSVSYGLQRSISNAVERNLNTTAMDLFEVRTIFIEAPNETLISLNVCSLYTR